MNYNQSTIGDMFSSKMSFHIPVYQRAYAWGRDNWKMFLDDILEQIYLGNDYTYGNILLEKKQNSVYDIIDGQQRLSTLIIFMRALIDVLEDKKYDQQDIEYIKQDYLENRGVKKLRPVDYDQVFFDSVIINGDTIKAESDSQQNYLDARNFFIRELSSIELNELLKIKKLIDNTTVNRLELEGKAEAALMFELQNNRGKSLTNLEKLKSFFMYQIYINSDKDLIESNVEALSNLFKEIYRLAHEIEGIDEDSILYYFCYSYLNKAFAYRNLDDIKEEYKDSSDKADDKGKARIDWIKTFIYELYKAFSAINTIQNGDYNYYKKLQSFSRSRKTIPPFAYAFIIKGYRLFNDDREKLEELMRILEVVAFRDNLINTRAELNSRLTPVLREFDGNLSLLRESMSTKLNEEGYWSDIRTKDFLRSDMYGNRVLNYLLWEYENNLKDNSDSLGKGYAVSIDTEEIEHISPQTPTDGTKIEVGYDINEKGEYDVEFIEKYLNSIGNLTLIDKKHNCAIGNKPFSEKLDSYKNSPLKQQKEIETILNEVGKGERWGVEHIEKRKEKIISYAIKRWSLI